MSLTPCAVLLCELESNRPMMCVCVYEFALVVENRTVEMGYVEGARDDVLEYMTGVTVLCRCLVVQLADDVGSSRCPPCPHA
jgi:hypothetical protein